MKSALKVLLKVLKIYNLKAPNTNLPLKIVARGFLGYFSHSYGGAVIGSERGQIASPLYPHNYPVSVNVVWTLYCRYNHIINYR